MNKRQRKKHHKKLMARFDAKMRDPEVMAKFAAVGAEHIRGMMLKQSFVRDILRPHPMFIEPWSTWRALGDEQLTHHVGTYPYVNGDGGTAWKRLCDYVTIHGSGVLLENGVVNCFACLAKEHERREQAPA